MPHGTTGDHRASLRSVKLLAGFAILIAVTGPLWLPSLLGSVNLRGPTEQAVARDRVAIEALEVRAIEAEQRLKASEGQLTVVRTEMAAIAQSVQALRDTLIAASLRDLGRALQFGGGFAPELRTLRGLVPANAEIAALLKQIEPYAETGVPDARAIALDYARLAGGGVMVDPFGWVRRTVFRTPVDPDRPEVSVAMAEMAVQMSQANLLGAVAVARGIPAPRPAGVDGWIQDAEARIAADLLMARSEELARPRAMK